MPGTLGRLGTALSGQTIAVLIGVGLLSLMLLGVFALIVRSLLRRRRGREQTRHVAQSIITPKRLLGIWQQFISPLPPSVRVALPDYDHFIVLGDPGVGKSALIARRIDWQGQASQFLPSYTPDPLMQVYLGSGLIAQEISATLLQFTTRDLHEAFRRLWRASLPSNVPPVVVVVLKAPALSTASPDVIRQQAQLIRGKINLLSERYGVPMRIRICLTNMERVRGYVEFARFLHKNRVPLILDVSSDADGGLIAALKAYEKYVPRALVALPVGRFEASINLLSSAEVMLGPVRSFITALVEGSVASVRPDVQRLYFFSLAADEDVGNPFDTTGLAHTSVPTAVSRLVRWMAALGISPLHTTLSLLIMIGVLLPLWLIQKRHGERVHQAAAAVEVFEQSVRHAQESLSNPSESDVVRRAELAASESLKVVEDAEAHLRPLRWLLRREQSAIRKQYVDAIRQGYLRPALESSVRQRQRDKILYALAALYATRENTLGAILRSATGDFATALALPVDVLTDYMRQSEQPWKERVLLLLPPLASEAGRYPIADLRPWRDFVQRVERDSKGPYITGTELDQVRKEAAHLSETTRKVRQAAVLRRMYQVLSEESPLDVNKLFGGSVGVLSPDPWLRDNMEQIERLLGLVREGSLQINRSGRMSLYALLKWINSLNARGEGGSREVLKDNDRIELAFPSTRIMSISEREWLELLLRSRKRFLLSYRVANSRAGGQRPPRCCECVGSHRHRQCVACTNGAVLSLRDRAELCRTNRTLRHEPALSRPEMPPFSEVELQPRLAQLATSAQAPSERLDEQYNRALFDNEVLPLLRELKRALAESKVLAPDEKLRLSRLVRNEITSYAHRYCAVLEQFHLSFHFHAGDGSVGDLHTALLGMTKPGSRFVSHLFAVADNASLGGLDDPFLAPLSDCLAEFQPIVRVMYGDQGPQSTKSSAKPAGKESGPGEGQGSGQSLKSASSEDAAKGSKWLKPQDLDSYLAAIAKQAEELDHTMLAAQQKPAGGSGGSGGGSGGASPSAFLLEEQLGPVGRAALAVLQGSDSSPAKKAEEFLDKAGIIGSLRRPFMAPFDAVYHRGTREIEQVAAEHWNRETLLPITQLLARFPFNQGAEREVSPSELELLNESGGSFWKDVRETYGPLLSPQSGTYRARSDGGKSINLPKDMIPTLNQLAKLARVLFDSTGKRQPLRFSVRSVPIGANSPEKQALLSVPFLQVGKSSVYGSNQRVAVDSMNIDWWNQGVALVGSESSAIRSNRRHTETLEVGDSAWGLFRLLQKSTLDKDGVSTWRILSDSEQDERLIRFVLTPDPWAPFRIRLPSQ